MPRWTSRYLGTGTFVAQSTGEGSRAISLDVHLVDCPGDAWLQVGTTCALRGSWGLSDLGLDEQNRAFHRGVFMITAGQRCDLAFGVGDTATVQVTNGVAKVDEARVLDLTLGGEIVSTRDGRVPATLAFRATPDGAMTDARCREPQ